MLPACSFASLHAPSTARSAAWLHAPSRFAPGEARFSASCPLRLPTPASPAAPPASTPPQEFYLPPDQSVLPDSLPANPPSDSARSPFAPRHRFLLLGFSAADPRSRSATFSEARCSSNLLEPPSLCARRPKWSIHFCARLARFPRYISALFTMSYSFMTVQTLWIKRGISSLFYCNWRIMPWSVAIQIWPSSAAAKNTRLATAR